MGKGNEKRECARSDYKTPLFEVVELSIEQIISTTSFEVDASLIF